MILWLTRVLPPRALRRKTALAFGLAAVATAVAPHLAAAQNITFDNVTYSEFKLGILDHDVHFLGGKEGGVDVNPEIIFQSPITDSWAATVPPYLRWIVQPRPTIGGEINTYGFTNQAYFGATWSWQLASNVLQPNDGVTLSFFEGPGFNDGDISVPLGVTDRKALGSHVLFREALELGYRINPVWTISAFLDHVSDAGLAKQNQSINDVGGRLGFHF